MSRFLSIYHERSTNLVYYEYRKCRQTLQTASYNLILFHYYELHKKERYFTNPSPVRLEQ